MIRSAAKASISRTRSPWPASSTSSTSAILSSVIVVSVQVPGLATRTFSEDRRWPPASPPAARCATPRAPRAASYTTTRDTAFSPARGRIWGSLERVMAGAAGFTANSLMYIIKYCQQQDMASIQILRERAFVRQPVHQAGAWSGAPADGPRDREREPEARWRRRLRARLFPLARSRRSCAPTRPAVKVDCTFLAPRQPGRASGQVAAALFLRRSVGSGRGGTRGVAFALFLGQLQFPQGRRILVRSSLGEGKVMPGTQNDSRAAASPEERRALDAEELQMANIASHPDLGELSSRELSDLVGRLRMRRNRARDIASRQGREGRASPGPQGRRRPKATPARWRSTNISAERLSGRWRSFSRVPRARRTTPSRGVDAPWRCPCRA